jgi:hypothetical protein
MDDDSVVGFAPAPGGGATRRWTPRAMFSAALAAFLPGRLAAQGDIATAGSGGYATASASGGTTVIGDINSGGNAGNVISVGETTGAVWVDGGDVSNSTSIGVTADGGTAIADASGGSYNVAVTGGFAS